MMRTETGRVFDGYDQEEMGKEMTKAQMKEGRRDKDWKVLGLYTSSQSLSSFTGPVAYLAP